MSQQEPKLSANFKECFSVRGQKKVKYPPNIVFLPCPDIPQGFKVGNTIDKASKSFVRNTKL